MPIASPLLSVCPRIVKRGGKLVACTALSQRILTLGAFCREVVIDPKAEVIRLRRRYLWFFKRAVRIPFGSVRAVTYGYSGSGGPHDWWWGAYKTTDAFRVGLRLSNFREVHLFWFSGEGPFTNYGPWPDWLYWEDYLLDFSGTQERESRAFVELLSKMIGVTVIPGRS